MESYLVSMLFNIDHSVILVVFLKIRVWFFGVWFFLFWVFFGFLLGFYCCFAFFFISFHFLNGTQNSLRI